MTSPDTPEVDFNCERLVDETTGLIGIHLEWSYRDENSYVRQAIEKYAFGLNFRTVLSSGTDHHDPGGVIDLNPTLSQQVSGTCVYL